MPDAPPLLLSISNRLVALHKQQFGRGPTRARSEWAGPDALVVFLDDALLPAEVQMVRSGAGHRVAEQRLFFQRASSDLFIGEVESLVGRKVSAFTSACDPEHGQVFELFRFHGEVASAPG